MPSTQMHKHIVKNHKTYKGQQSVALKSLDNSAHKQQIQEQNVSRQDGIIKSTYVSGDYVYAMIQMDNVTNNTTGTNEGVNSLLHGNGIFGIPEGYSLGIMTLPETMILTDIDPATATNPKRHKGAKCSVEMYGVIPIRAYIRKNITHPTIFAPEHVRKARLLGKGDLKDPAAVAYLKSLKYTSDDIDNLHKLTFDNILTNGGEVTAEAAIAAVNVMRVAGDAVYHTDTSAQVDGEAIIESNPILTNLNKLTMKSKDCHLPPIFFSGK